MKCVSVIILYDNERRILLQHRTEDAPSYPNYWAFFGGGIERGESAEQAIKREVLEELSYRLTDPRLFTTQRFNYRGRSHAMHAFCEKYDGSPLILGEGQGMGWFSFFQTKALRINKHDRLVIEAMNHFLDHIANTAGIDAHGSRIDRL
jgi:8-oxo-dGTP diphosphatase